MLFTKFRKWRYEQEWRIFHKESNKECVYAVDALKAVYFGTSVDNADREIACLILREQNKKIKFYQAYKEKSKYSLSFEEFT